MSYKGYINKNGFWKKVEIIDDEVGKGRKVVKNFKEKMRKIKKWKSKFIKTKVGGWKLDKQYRNTIENS